MYRNGDEPLRRRQELPAISTKLNSRSEVGSDEVSNLGRQKRNGAYYVVCISTVVLLGFIAEKEICKGSVIAEPF